MYKHIVVPATGTACDPAVFATALLVARRFGAHIEFVHARIDVTEVVVAMSAGGAGGTVQSVVDQLETDARLQEQKAWTAFTDFCTGAGLRAGGAEPGTGLSADMVVETGNEGQWLAEYGRFADLTVVGRTRDGDDVVMDVLQAALLDTARPVMIAPRAAPAALPGIVVIAWKDTVQAARAVAAAMPLIEAADRVVIICVGEGGVAEDPSAERLLGSLRWHNAATSVQHLVREGRAPVDVLLEAAAEAGAGLLVMGGYGHSQLREVVFGGFTQHILRGADLPVLMVH